MLPVLQIFFTDLIIDFQKLIRLALPVKNGFPGIQGFPNAGAFAPAAW
jgi:hypothetical protein